MRRSVFGYVVVLGFTVSCGGNDIAPPDDGSPDRHIAFRRTRVAVADAEVGQVTIIDAEFSEIRATLELPGPATLHASGTGSVAAAVDAADGTVRFLTPGVSSVDHTGEGWEGNEHIHVYKFVPTVLDATVTGANPGTLMANRSAWAAYFAGDENEPASAARFDEAPLIQNDVLAPMIVQDDSAHPGFALPLDSERILMATGQPDGVAWFDGAGMRMANQMGCSGLADALPIGDQVVVSCEEGLWLVETATPGATPTTIPYPTATRPHGLSGHIDQSLVATIVDGTVTVFDVDGGQSWTVPSDALSCDVAFEPAYGESLVTLGNDGHVRMHHIVTGELELDLEAAAGFSCDAAIRPRLAVAPQLAYVSLPSTGEVVELNLKTGSPIETYAVGGRPGQLLILGVDPHNRNAGPCPECR